MQKEEEVFFFGCLQDILVIEKDLEKQKIALALKSDFNLIDAFS